MPVQEIYLSSVDTIFIDTPMMVKEGAASPLAP